MFKMTDNKVKSFEKIPAEVDTSGLASSYLFSGPGIIRILNLALGGISLGLWIPGFASEFFGERVNPNNVDTTWGYGNGFSSEALNDFVLAAIIICMIFSLLLLLGVLGVPHASVDWNRLNKWGHLILGIFLFVAFICGIFGVWYFQENCCHVGMSFGGTYGVMYDINSKNGYSRHCYCYLTRYLIGNADSEETQTDQILWDATKTMDKTGFNESWRFSAHHIYVHVAAIFIILLNSVLYFLAFIFSRNK